METLLQLVLTTLKIHCLPYLFVFNVVKRFQNSNQYRFAHLFTVLRPLTNSLDYDKYTQFQFIMLSEFCQKYFGINFGIPGPLCRQSPSFELCSAGYGKLDLFAFFIRQGFDIVRFQHLNFFFNFSTKEKFLNTYSSLIRIIFGQHKSDNINWMWTSNIW